MKSRPGLRSSFFVLALGGALAFLPGCGGDPTPVVDKPGGLTVGDRAADFALLDQTGRIVRLSDAAEGWYLVLIFYRGHWCPACLEQILEIKQRFADLSAVKAGVAAVSVDPVEKSANLWKEWRLLFPLLSDPKLRLIDAYGLRHPKGHEGRDISKPAIIILDPQRTIRYKYVGRSPVDRPSLDELLHILRQLQSAAKP